jgi:hypothetical protein
MFDNDRRIMRPLAGVAALEQRDLFAAHSARSSATMIASKSAPRASARSSSPPVHGESLIH